MTQTELEKLGELLYKLENAKFRDQEIGIKFSGTSSEIKKQYYKFLKNAHPDMYPNKSKEEEVELTSYAQYASEAYDHISKEMEKNKEETCSFIDDALKAYESKKSKAEKNAEKNTTESQAKTYTKNKEKASNQKEEEKEEEDSLKFNGGILRKILTPDNKHRHAQTDKGIRLYAYSYTDKNGKEYTIVSESDFKDFSNPVFKTIIENELLSKENLENANSEDVQDPDSQYGYVGKLDYSFNDSAEFRVRKTRSVQDFLRQFVLDQTNELHFNGGTLKRLYTKQKTHAAMKIDRDTMLYGYVYKDSSGVSHKIFTEMEFEDLSIPNYKTLIEEKMLSQENLKNSDSYNVQDITSQYGYVGKVAYNYGDTEDNLIVTQSNDVKYLLRNKKLEHTTQLQFGDKILEKKLEKSGNQHKIDFYDGTELFAYKVTRKDKTQVIYTTNSFEELANPYSQTIISNELLNDERLDYAKSTGLDYVGEISNHGTVNYSRNIHEELEDLDRSMICFRIAEDQSGKQKTITLKNGEKLYGYNISSKRIKDDKGRDLYFENPVKDLVNNIENFLENDGNKFEVFDILNSSLAKSILQCRICRKI